VAAGGARLEAARALHREAAADFVAAASAVPAQRWSEPLGEGKWTPAQVVEHLNLAYDLLLAELAGGAGMQVRTRRWQRWLLRLTLVPRLLRGAPFPAGARAPRETRPTGAGLPQAAAIAAFRDRAERFDVAAAAAAEQGSRRRITHAYFGSASVADGVTLCARHIGHHRGQLPTPARAEALG
jgi:hypothetical protein